jgi:hypothetical protein
LKDGFFVLAKTAWLFMLCVVEVGEAIGLHTMIWWVANLQLDSADFVLDSKKVVDYFHQNLVVKCMHVSRCSKFIFKTLLSSLDQFKSMGSLMF